MSTPSLHQILNPMSRSQAIAWVQKNHGVSFKLARQIVEVAFGEAKFGDTGKVRRVAKRSARI